MNYALGIIGGLGLGLLYAFARWKMDRRIRSVEEVRETFGTPVLGIIPEDDRLADHREIIETGTSGGRGHHAFSEALRELRTNLSFVSVDAPPRVVVVTSSMPGEGKSSITANLAVAIASTGRDVVVVDGDLRRPVMTELFGLVPGVGITDVLVGEAEVDDVLQVYDKFPNLQVLGAGRTPPNPTELLASQAMRTMLAGLAEDAFVLVDAPPLLPVTDAALLTASADGALVVATAQGTTVDELGKALGNIEQVRGRVLGVVLNHVPTTGADAGFYGYYGKGYYASDDSGEDAVEAPVRPAKEVPAAGTAAPASSAPDTGSTAVLETESPADAAVSDLPADEPKAERFDLSAWQRPGKGMHRA
ncbi:CpsD/CapB family tyrosine-protein kinase [Kocuria flava]|uniref:CpsD/CapB family tyrosine-protein kinase n=1 Tax=Kocuria flava TaxID=446860 RepID=UPI002F91FE46